MDDLEGVNSTHIFDWTRKWIDFASYRGHTLNPVNETEILARWRYYGDDNPDSDEKLKINRSSSGVHLRSAATKPKLSLTALKLSEG